MKAGRVPDRWVALSCRLYGLAIGTLPASERRRSGEAMLDLFGRLAYEARRHGIPRLAVLMLAAIGDVLVQAVRLRTVLRREGAAGEGRRRPASRNKGHVVDNIWLDARQAARSLGRRPLFTALAVATFALGIGANTSIFTVVHAVLLRDLPYESPDRIVRLMGTWRGEVNREGTLSYLNFRDIYARSTAFSAASAYDEWRPNLTGGGEPELIDAAQVNAGFFEVFGVAPAVGRYFLPEEDFDGQDRVVVLSWGLWQTRYGGDPGIVGSAVLLNGNAHTVVGVAPRAFEDPMLSGDAWGRPVLWRPLGYLGLPEASQPARGSSSYVAVARLAPGVTIERARDELAALSTALAAEFPAQNEDRAMTVVPLGDSIVGDVRGTLLILLGAVGFVLAIAAANVGNLLLSRATERRRDIAIRSALGASRGRIVGQTMIESLLLAGTGGLVGLGLGIATTRLLGDMARAFVPRSDVLGMNAAVLAFAVVVTLAAGLACGMLPALLTAMADPRSSLGEAARGTSESRRSGRLRHGLVVAEVSLALMLLVGAGLLGRSLWKLMRVDIGIDPAGLLTFDLAPPAATYPDSRAVAAFYGELLERLRHVPGVTSVSSVNIAPLTGSFDCNAARLPGRESAGDAEVCPEVRTVTPGHFRTAGLTILRGRPVGETDRAGATPVAVVTEALAQRFWPGESPIGQQFIVVDTTVEVVGVAADVKHLRLEDSSPPMVFLPATQELVPWHGRRMTVVMRMQADPVAAAPAVHSIVRALDAQLPITNLRSMESILSQAAAGPRFRTTLIGAFASLALLLASIGIYGVVSYSVSRRTRELAIRMALGARAAGVMRMVVRDGLKPVALGVALGLAGAYTVSRVLAAVLFGVTATDRLVFTTVPLVLLAVAAVATLAPARRATTADPMSVLRES